MSAIDFDDWGDLTAGSQWASHGQNDRPDPEPTYRTPLPPGTEALWAAAAELRRVHGRDPDDPILPIQSLATLRVALAIEALTVEVKALREQASYHQPVETDSPVDDDWRTKQQPALHLVGDQWATAR